MTVEGGVRREAQKAIRFCGFVDLGMDYFVTLVHGTFDPRSPCWTLTLSFDGIFKRTWTRLSSLECSDGRETTRMPHVAQPLFRGAALSCWPGLPCPFRRCRRTLLRQFCSARRGLDRLARTQPADLAHTMV